MTDAIIFQDWVRNDVWRANGFWHFRVYRVTYSPDRAFKSYGLSPGGSASSAPTGYPMDPTFEGRARFRGKAQMRALQAENRLWAEIVRDMAAER